MRATKILEMWKWFLVRQLLLSPDGQDHLHMVSKLSSKCLNDSSRAHTLKLGSATLFGAVNLASIWSCVIVSALARMSQLHTVMMRPLPRKAMLADLSMQMQLVSSLLEVEKILSKFK